MSKICYVPRNFQADSLAMIVQANKIIAEYEAQGLRLTLRQLYYQHVARGLIANKQAEYKRLGSIVNDGRLAGLIDWDAIEDRTRSARLLSHWKTGADIVESASWSFALDKWKGQQYRPEAWVEKEALAGVFEAACQPLDVTSFACRGYVSQSEMWAAGQRLRRYQNAGAQPVILHFGDHDPSGIDMTRDIRERLSMFVVGGSPRRRPPIVVRVALNMDQIEELQPPPNPGKDTDSRFAAYREQFGDQSWELDALDPRALRKLIEENVAKYRDDSLWDAQRDAEIEEKIALRAAASQWDQIKDSLAEKIRQMVDDAQEDEPEDEFSQDEPEDETPEEE